MRKILKWTLGLLICVTLIATIVVAMLPQPVPVDVAPVTVGSMQVTVDEEGRTRIRERYVVSSPLVGRLRRITLHAGDRVRADQTVLAVIEPTDPTLLDARTLAEAEGRVRAADAAVRQAGATLESARAAYDLAEAELGRIASAFEQGAANTSEMDRARTEERQTIEAYRAAQFGQEIAEYELEVARSALLFAKGGADELQSVRMPLTSPIDGAVLRVFQESVSVVTPGTPLIEVGDPQDLEIVIDVLSTDGVNIEPGQHVIIEQWGKPEPLEAVVRLVEPSAFTKISALGIEEQRVNVIADFVTPPTERASLGDGFRVEASVVVWEQAEALQVPSSAVFRDGERWAVFLIEGDTARLRSIEIGRQNGRISQVLSGLADTDHVVLHPSDQLSDGTNTSIRVDN